MLHAVHLASKILLLDGSALVIFLLTAGKSNEELGITIISNIELDSDDGQSFFLDRTLKLIQFLTAEEQLTVTSRIVLSPTSPPLLRYMHILDI